jgi:hypothetical protein
MLYVDRLKANLVLDKEIPDVDVSGIRPSQFTSVLFEADCALVILIEDILFQYTAGVFMACW